MDKPFDIAAKQLVRILKQHLITTVKHLPKPELGSVYRETNIDHCNRDISKFESTVEKSIEKFVYPRKEKLELEFERLEKLSAEIPSKINLLK
jgi:hypothetical protein